MRSILNYKKMAPSIMCVYLINPLSRTPIKGLSGFQLAKTMEADHENHESKPHLVFMPYMAQGHLIPMVDMARLFARRGAAVTIITTPANAARFAAITEREIAAGLSIQTHTVPFPAVEAGLPEGCETLDVLPSGDMIGKFFNATIMLRGSVELLLKELRPKPLCIISDLGIPWSTKVAHNLRIPRFVFHGFGCFSLLAIHNFRHYNMERVISDLEPFSIPGLPETIKFTKSQTQLAMGSRPESQSIRDSLLEGEATADGVVMNTFDALEQEYLVKYQKAKGKRVWTVGPISLCNATADDKADRGSKSIANIESIRWLDMKDPKSVIYVSFGSVSNLKTSDMIAVGLGLEASNHNFIWVIRLGKNSQEIERWLGEENFEERVKGKGLVIKGWAPQVLILSHPSTGAFLTHCGWNSTLEGICAGVPMATCPIFAEQFFNEKLIVEVLQVGVSLGVRQGTAWGREEEMGDQIDKESVKKGVETVMYEGEEGEERRKRAQDWAKLAKQAMEVGGSSYRNVDLLLDFASKYAGS